MTPLSCDFNYTFSKFEPVKQDKLVQKADSLIKSLQSSYWPFLTLRTRVLIRKWTQQELTLSNAQAIYGLSMELKNQQHKKVWKKLPANQQNLLHRLNHWIEHPSKALFQWLGDGDLERAIDKECVTDFGNGRLFRVLPPQKREGRTIFPLAQNLNFYLEKTTEEESFPTPSYFLSLEKMGRIAEIFDVQNLEGSAVLKNQLKTLFFCYRAAICRLFDLSVSIPSAIGDQGEWTIWENERTVFTEGTPLTETQLKDLHRFFFLEKKLRINFLADETGRYQARWRVCNGHLLQEGPLPLPSLISGDIAKRHEGFLKRFNLDAQSKLLWTQWDEEPLDSEFLKLNLDLDSLHEQLVNRSSKEFLEKFQSRFS